MNVRAVPDPGRMELDETWVELKVWCIENIKEVINLVSPNSSIPLKYRSNFYNYCAGYLISIRDCFTDAAAASFMMDMEQMNLLS